MAKKQRDSLASDHKSNVVEAATGVFLRYGYARTTMADLANAAGLSRPALYTVFPCKEDIFAAVLQRMSDESLRKFRAALPELLTLGKKLHHCCETWGTHGFDMIAVHPDAKDLFNLSFVPVQEVYAAFRDFIAELLAEPAATAKVKARPEDLASILVYAMRGFEEIAKDKAQMQQMISLQVEVVLASLAG